MQYVINSLHSALVAIHYCSDMFDKVNFINFPELSHLETITTHPGQVMTQLIPNYRCRSEERIPSTEFY